MPNLDLLGVLKVVALVIVAIAAIVAVWNMWQPMQAAFMGQWDNRPLSQEVNRFGTGTTHDFVLLRFVREIADAILPGFGLYGFIMALLSPVVAYVAWAGFWWLRRVL